MRPLESAIEAVLPETIAFRRDLHAHPELGYQEVRTSAKVREALAQAGIAFQSGLAGGTGVLGFIPSSRGADAPTIALRADMDALPIEEQTGRSYTSQNPGTMHACGHDGHTAILVATARVLAQEADRPNNVVLVFQPAEEGGGGGRRMLEDGALDGRHYPAASRIYGLHGYPYLPVGKLSTKVGPMMASADSFEIVVKGKGAHAAMPHTGIDPVVASAHIVTALQTIASRSTNPLDSVVVSVTMIHAGTANNIIPEQVQMRGTLRALRPEVRESARAQIIRIAESVAAGLGSTATVSHFDGYPMTVNDAQAVDAFKAVVRESLPGSLEADTMPTMGAEDFSFYGAQAQACFYWLGLEGDSPVPNLHSPFFDFNDDALPVGIRAMASLALKGA